jgi:tetratricopeptide (TPR) repeat protein
VLRPDFRAFISYSHRDSGWAAWLHKAIESYRPPKSLVGQVTERGEVPKRLTPVFRDREELASSTDLGAAINDALNRSACQIVICSPHAAKSRWVNEEILAFKRLGREDRIFCLIVGGEPNASDDPQRIDEECFPPALRYRLDADGNLGTVRTEPIAADARPGKDRRLNAKLKIIAGLLGLGFDALKRRDQQRRHRRLFAIACAACAGMILATGLAGYALVQRARAERQTARAEMEAESLRQTTDFLVDLFRISDPGEARGNVVTAREMLDKGAARIDTELAGQPAIQATLLDTVGTVYMGLGLYRQSKSLLDRAVATRRALARTEPVSLSVSLNHFGDLLTLQAQFDAAEKSYRDALALATSQPENRQVKAALARSLQGLGDVLARQGHYPEAEQSLRAALLRQHQLFGEASADIARTLQALGNVLFQEGNLGAAIGIMQQAEAMQRHLHGSDPHPDLAGAINDLALLRDENGDYDAALKLYSESLAMKRRLLGDRHPEIAAGLSNLASILNDKGDLAASEATYRQALAMQRELLGEVHPDTANTLNNLAFVQYDRGNRRAALQTEREALDVYRRLFPGDHPEVARINNRIGYWLTEAGDYGEAERELRDALAMRERLLGDKHPDVAGSLTHLAILQVATGKYADAMVSARSAVEIFTPALTDSHWRTAVAESAEGAALAGLGKYASAEKLLLHSTAILGKENAGAPMTYRTLAQGYLARLRKLQAGRVAGRAQG